MWFRRDNISLRQSIFKSKSVLVKPMTLPFLRTCDGWIEIPSDSGGPFWHFWTSQSERGPKRKHVKPRDQEISVSVRRAFHFSVFYLCLSELVISQAPALISRKWLIKFGWLFCFLFVWGLHHSFLYETSEEENVGSHGGHAWEVTQRCHRCIHMCCLWYAATKWKKVVSKIRRQSSIFSPSSDYLQWKFLL